MINLRPYQEKILDKLRAAFAEGHRSVMLYAPTGAGKTEMAMHLMLATAEKGNRSAIVLDRIVLCDQTSRRLMKYGISHGVLRSGSDMWRPYEKIQVCSAQTLEKRGELPDMKLLIIDEAHCTRTQTTEFVKNSKIRSVGLSATPFTKGLGKIYSAVVSAVTTDELVRDGALVPLRVFTAKEIDMSGAKKIAGEWSEGEVTERARHITGDIVAEWEKKTFEVFGRPRKTIVFCAGVAHGEELAKRFASSGYDFRAISYKMDEQLKRDIIEDFSRPDTDINGLIATDILTKGFDVPDVMIGVSARPFSRSLSSHIQQLGRVMRPCNGKEFALWICHSGNYIGFQDEWEDVYYNGVQELDDGKEKPRKERTQNEKEACKCPKCHAVWSSRSPMCLVCGFVRPVKSLVEEVPGEVVELESKRVDRVEKQTFYSELLGYAEGCNFNNPNGWVAHKYKEKFGVWPRGLRDVPKVPSPETARWVKSRMIAWQKSKARA